MKQASRWSLALLVTVSLPVLRAQAEQPVIQFPSATGSSTAATTTVTKPQAAPATTRKTTTTTRTVTRTPAAATAEAQAPPAANDGRSGPPTPPPAVNERGGAPPSPPAVVIERRAEQTSPAPVREATGAPPVQTAPAPVAEPRHQPAAVAAAPPLTPQQQAARQAAATWDRGGSGPASSPQPQRLWPQVKDMWPQPPSHEVPLLEPARPRVGAVVPRPPAPLYGGGPPPGYPPYPRPDGGIFDFGR